MKKYSIEDKSFDILSEEEEKSFRKETDRRHLFSLNQKQQKMNTTNNNTKEHQTQPQTDIKIISEIDFTNLEINDDSIIIQNNNNSNTYHQIQIIDEDLENFKRRFDIMIKNFRTETLTDFMKLKRNMLFEQNKVVQREKQKYEAMLSSKEDLIEHLKENLTQTNQELNCQISIKEKISILLFNDKQTRHIAKLKQLAFLSILKKNHDQRKVLTHKEALLRKKYQCRLKTRAILKIKSYCKEMKFNKLLTSKENQYQTKMNEMSQHYNKVLMNLNNKLQEANKITEKTKEAKNAIQENLKNVLMRGVMAMNMEAMNVIDKDIDIDRVNTERYKDEGDQIDNNDMQIEENTSYNLSNNENQLSNNPLLKLNSLNDTQQKYYDTNPVASNTNKDHAPLIPNLDINATILQRDLYENEINMEILDTCKSEEMSSRQNKLIQTKPLDGKYKDQSSITNILSNNHQRNTDYYEDSQRSKNSIHYLIDFPSVKNDFQAVKEKGSIEGDIENNELSEFDNEYKYQYTDSFIGNPDYDTEIGIKGSNKSNNTETNNTINHKINKTDKNTNNQKRNIISTNITNNYQILNNNKKNVHTSHNTSQFKPETISKGTIISNIKQRK